MVDKDFLCDGRLLIIVRHFVLMGVMLAILSSCKSDYSKLVERELENGRQDSLFLGLHFGMTQKEFFNRCLELNRLHITTNGYRGNYVLYKLQDSVGIMYMHFYPEFSEDRIYEIRAIFTYQNWSIGNSKTQPDSLQRNIKRLFDRWYPAGYLITKRHEGDTVYVKVNGNRRIVIYKEGEMDVKAIFTDLLVENKIKK